MIINLTGNIASGKTTFARWFINRNPSWAHLDIAEYRTKYNQFDSKIRETMAWSMLGHDLLDIVRSSKSCIVESTGTIYRLGDIWAIASGVGIYTIMLDTPAHICKQRAMERDKDKGEFECYCIEHEELECFDTPVNLVVISKQGSPIRFYPQIETKILEVEKLLQQTTAEVL